MADRHHTRPDLTDRLGAHPTETTADRLVRVRRWDEPQPLDPYPEHPPRHPGVRQSNHLHAVPDWEFNNGLPVTGPVVRAAMSTPAQVITDDRNPLEHVPLAANNLAPGLLRRPRLTLWAVGISIVAQSTVTAAIRWGDAEPAMAAAVSVGTLLCSLLLIAAEQITGRCHR